MNLPSLGKVESTISTTGGYEQKKENQDREMKERKG